MPNIHFGSELIGFELDPGDSLTEREPADLSRDWNRDRFANSLSSARFDKFLGYGKPLVVVNDAFRPTPTGEILSLIKEIHPRFEADFIVACGNHPAPEDEDLEEIFSSYERSPRGNLYFHDCRNLDDMSKVGELDGEPVYLNKNVFAYPALILIGSVEPHYFAGYTGGRKSIVPGLTDFESNRRNHALAVSADAQPLRLENNPVVEDLERMLALMQLPPLFSMQIVSDRRRQILDCFCGDLKSSFSAAVDLSKEVYTFRSKRQYDLVIAEMCAPLDRNLYQLQKAIENCAPAARDGGTVVAVSKCGEGIGNDEFYQLARHLKNEEMVLSRAELDNPPMGIHKLSRIVRIKQRINVRAITGLKREILEQVFIEPAVSLEAEMQKLKSGEKKEEKDIDILLVRDAGLLAVTVD
jgi:nickel-dependent lactate racemase